MPIEDEIKAIIRDVYDFPKQGIVFKDLTPILKSPTLCKRIGQELASRVSPLKPDALVAMDSRGFWFGLLIATELSIPLIPVRKAGKLPYKTISTEYELEYGSAKIEMHSDALQPHWKVLVHDDLLATGGTASAASQLIEMQQSTVCGYSFLVELDFLEGRNKLLPFSNSIHSLIHY